MRLASSCIVMASGMTTSRKTFACGSDPMPCLLARSRLRLIEARLRWRVLSSRALEIVRRPRRRCGSPLRLGVALLSVFWRPLRFSASGRFSRVLSVDAASLASGLSSLAAAAEASAACFLASSSALRASSSACLASSSSRSRFKVSSFFCCSASTTACLTSSASRTRALARALARATFSSSVKVLRTFPEERCSTAGRGFDLGATATFALIGSGFFSAGFGGASTAPPGAEIVRLRFFSTRTDFERPWEKFCRTWPDSTVRRKLNGFLPPAVSLCSVSLVSLMHFTFYADGGPSAFTFRHIVPAV